MGIRAADQELPHDRGLSLLLEKKSTKCEAHHVPLKLENCHNIEDRFRNILVRLENKNIMDNTEEGKGLLSDMRTEIRHIIQSTKIHVLKEYFHTLDQNNSALKSSNEDIRPICLFYLVAYHELVLSEKKNITHILNVIHGCLQTLEFALCQSFDYIFLYFDIYYNEKPNDIFILIHTIWKLDPTTELDLKLAYCEKLMEAKNNKTLKQLIHNHADYFIESFDVIKPALGTTTTRILLHILHQQVPLYKTEEVKTNEATLSRTIINHRYLDKKFLFYGFDEVIQTLDHKQILCTPYLIRLLQPVMKVRPIEFLRIILLCSDRLRQAHHYTECIKFIKCNFQFILSFPTDKLKTQRECYCRKQYCITLLLLLDEYASCHETHKMNLVFTRLLEFRVSFLSEIRDNSCYCLMGNQECLPTFQDLPLIPHISPSCMPQFPPNLINCTLRRNLSILLSMDLPHSEIRIPPSEYEYQLRDFNIFMEQIIQGNFELASYLEIIIKRMSNNMYKNIDESAVFFSKFIKRLSEHNEELLYDIVKMLCAYELQPRVQDMVLRGLTEFLIVSCNGQYCMLSKQILDINMLCPKGQFIQKLTSGIAKLWPNFYEDTENDFSKIIYKCYCILRHDSKNVKDTNIAKYKDHFTFIASMEVEEKMKKMTNILLMLTSLLIASGGHHMSAELKKYLSLKYEYRDSILYLLWCSGDVEINPGPTLSTLRKVPDSVKERNWINEMCSILLRLLKYKSIELKNDGLWEDKPLHWPTDCLFYNPRNKPQNSGYNIGTDKKLLECLEEHCNLEGVFNETTHFDDEPTKLKVKQYQKEIFAWKNNRSELFEQYILRQVLDTLKAAKGSLHKYRKELEFNPCVFDIYVELIFNSREDSNGSKKSYTDIVRDIATTFCRIGKGLNYLEKSAGIWDTPPSGWNPNHPYYSPCNDKKGRHKGQDDKLVDNLLTYCESNNITIPSELQPLIMAWKQGKRPEITKSYTIWSKTAIVKHSLQYLELEGMLGKIHVQESLKQIGVILDKQHWKCQKITSTDNDDKSQDSGLSNTSHSSPCIVNTTANRTNSSLKILSFQTIQNNQLKKFTNSTNANLNAACDSSYCYDSHENNHVCHTEFNLDNKWNQSSNHTCVSSCRDSCSTLTRKTQSEADDKHHPISAINSSNSKYQLISSDSNLNEQLIPSTVYIHDDTSKPERKSNNISKTAKKRHRDNNDESCSEPKRLNVSEEDLPLFLQVLTSSSDNGKDIANTSPKGNSNDCKITTFSTDHLSHDSISMKSRPNFQASGKQTDQLVINKLPDTSNGKPVDLFSYTQADNENKKGETTSDQWVNQIVNLLEEIEQDYSATVVEPSSGQTSSHRSSNEEIDNAVKNIQTTSDLDYNVKEMINLLEEMDPVFISDTLETHKLSPCSLTDQPSDYSDELPDHVESIIDELLNSNDTNNTFDLMNGS